MTVLVGILNLTRDSFSDGGRHLDPDVAVRHALALARDGAGWIDVGAESTHPDAERVSEAEEIARLSPVVERLVAEGIAVSVDTWKPGVMRHALALGARMINDVRGLRTPGAVDAVRDSDARLVVMHSASPEARARRAAGPADELVVERVRAFLAERVEALAAAGVDRERVILDPGMGFFLSADPEPSLAVLRGLPRLRTLGRPLYVCTSRKSFLGALTGRPAAERGAATLASELFAARLGADFVRTHDVRALADALAVDRALDAPDPSPARGKPPQA